MLNGLFEVIVDGRIAGPFTIGQLKEMHLNGHDFVKPQGYADFKEIRELKELGTALSIEYEWVLPQYFATLDMRLLAIAIDYTLVVLVYAVFSLTWILALHVERAGMIRLLLYGMVVIPCLKFLLGVVTEGSSKQATPGKRIVGIKVCSTKGHPIGFARAAGRNVAKLAGVLTLGIGFLSGFFDRRQQCFHDKMAATLVVKDRLI